MSDERDPATVPQSHYSVARASRALGVSPRRVRAMLTDGILDGHREGGIWLVDRASVAERAKRKKVPVRPLSNRSLAVLVGGLSHWLGDDGSPAWQGAEPVERFRAKERVERLLRHDRPAELLRAWAEPERQSMVELQVSDRLAKEVVESGRAVVSGVSHHMSFLSPSMTLEVHADKVEARRLEREADEGRIRAVIHSPERPWSIAEVLVDLALHDGRREDDDVRRILGKVQDRDSSRAPRPRQTPRTDG